MDKDGFNIDLADPVNTADDYVIARLFIDLRYCRGVDTRVRAGSMQVLFPGARISPNNLSLFLARGDPTY